MSTSRREVLTGAAAAAAAALLPSSAAKSAPSPPPASMQARTVVERAAAKSVLYERASGSLLPVSALGSVLRKTGRRSPVIIGEIHNEVGSHAAQLAVLETLLEQGGGLTVGFEMFGAGQTPILNSYVDGEIDLDEMLEKTQWNDEWGYAAGLYAPIFRFCRKEGVRMIGINIPSKLIRAVSAVGLAEIEKSYPAVRALLPKVVDTSNTEHRAHFMRAMGFGSGSGSATHAGMNISPELLQRYYESQVVWDETMAEQICRAVAADEGMRVVALVGTGHMETHSAIPERIEKRLDGMGCEGVKPFSIATRLVEWTQASPDVSLPDITMPERTVDMVWYTRSQLDLA